MRRLFIISILLFLGLEVFCSPPRKGVFLMYQPDGTSFKATLRGDESCKVLMTPEGHAVVKCDDGYYRYAVFGPDGSRSGSAYKPGEETPREILTASRNIPWKLLRRISAKFRRDAVRSSPARRRKAGTRAATEKRHCLVILAQFPDISFMNGESRRQDFIDLITKEGSKSVLDYFNDQFLGTYDFNFTVGPVVTLSRNHDYYGQNDEGKAGKDLNPQELVAEACTLSDPYIDFSQFDDDGDGRVDNVFVIVAGKNEAEGADSDYLWPHQWSVPDLRLDGKRVYSYALSTELTVHSQNSNGQLVWGLCTIGTFCHEYSHILGLRDYYDTDGEGSGGEAETMWVSTALMDGGNFNDSGRTPPSYNAVDREILGIGKPETMALGNYELEPVSEKGHYLILENPNEHDEFFVFECRAQKGWDAYIGGSGLAIYHVDMSYHEAGWSDDAAKNVTAHYRWDSNEVNCNPDFQCADMMETVENAMEVRQAFFPFKTVNSFSANSKPSFKFNDGTEPPFAISGITRVGDKVRFTVYNSSDVVPKAADISCEVYQDAAILTWDSDVAGFDGKASVTWGKTSGAMKTEEVSPFEPGKYAITLEGLSPTTAYTVDISFTRSGVSGETVSVDFLTKAVQTSGKPYIYLDYQAYLRTADGYPSGIGLPLRVFNAIGERVSWSYDGASVHTDGSGYFHPAKSGTLKAVVSHSDGSKDILSKEIRIR